MLYNLSTKIKRTPELTLNIECAREKGHEIKQQWYSPKDAVRSKFGFYIREEDKSTDCIGVGKWRYLISTLM